MKKYFANFAYFYRYIGYRLFLAVILSIAVGVLDGFGLSMFLPLLQMVNDKDAVTSSGSSDLGNLNFLIDAFNSIGLTLNLHVVLIILCLFFIFKGIAQFFRGSYQVKLQQHFIKKIRLNLIRLFNNVTYKFFVLSDVGRIQNTFSGEVDKVARAYQTYFNAMQSSILVLVYMGFAFFIDYKFAILVSIGGALTNIIFKKIYANTKGASRELTGENHVFQSLIMQRVYNFKYLKASGRDLLFSRKLVESVEKIEGNNKKIGILSAILTASREPMLIMVVSVVIFVQTYFFEASLGPILISLLFFYRALNYLMQVQTQWNLFLAVSGSLQNMTEFSKTLEQNKEATGKDQFLSLNNEIAVNDLMFSYQEGVPILKNINLDIKKNETVAFVGESGSGKTTLINILSGLMEGNEGAITLDGKNIGEVNVRSYQEHIGYITQDPVIFNDTIFNNVTFWDDPTPENIERFKTAINQASISEFINTLKDRENTVLENNGINLSGGQKQRISIARELYRNISILILDEATSALDSETEKLIQQNIDSLHGKYTILIVAHRLSTVKNADRIIFMNKGEIENSGSFSELVESSPSFSRMVKLQEL